MSASSGTGNKVTYVLGADATEVNKAFADVGKAAKGTSDEVKRMLEAYDTEKVERKLRALAFDTGLAKDETLKLYNALQDRKAPASAEDAGEKISTSFKNASLSARGLAQDFGVTLPRSVSAFLAQSQTIGPVLSAAFSTVAVVGIAETLGRIPKILDDIIDKYHGWDKAAQDVAANALRDNKKTEEIALQSMVAHRNVQAMDINNPAALAAFNAGTVQSEIDFRQGQAKIVQQRLASIEKEYQDIEKATGFSRGAIRTMPESFGYRGDDLENRFTRVKELDAEQKKLSEEASENTNVLLDLYNVKLPEALGKSTHAAKELSAEIALFKDYDLGFLINKLTQNDTQTADRVMGRNRSLQDIFGIQVPELPASVNQVRGIIPPLPSDALTPFSGGSVHVGNDVVEDASANNAKIIQLNQDLFHQVLESNRAFTAQATAEDAAAAHYRYGVQEAEYQRERQLMADITHSFSDSLGHVWDDFYQKGESVLGSIHSLISGVFDSAMRSLFKAGGNFLLTGNLAGNTKGVQVGGLLGVAMQNPTLSKLLGSAGFSGVSFGGLGLSTSSLANSTSVINGQLAPTVPGMPVGGDAAASAADSALSGAAGVAGVGASLAKVGLATNPIGLAIAGVSVLGTLFSLSSLFRKRQYQDMTDPLSNAAGRTMWFNSTAGFEATPSTGQNSTSPFAKLAAAADSLNQAVTHLNTQPPGVVTKAGYPAIHESVKDSVVRGMDDRTFRKAVSGAVLEHAI